MDTTLRPLRVAILILLLCGCAYGQMAPVVASGNNVIVAATGGQLSTSNWGNCGSTACAGGAGNTSGISQTTGNALPSVSGASMALIATFPATGNNVLFFWKPASCDVCETATHDSWVYVPTGVANYEFDQFIYDQADNVDAMFGHQCNTTTGFWQYANQTSGWTNGPIACSLSTATWHHLIFSDYWRHGDTACGGSPCLHFGSIQIDGVTNSWGGITLTTTALPGGFTRAIGCQYQMDSSAASTATEYVDLVNCWMGR
jgi:hypothetical protein